MRRYGLCPLHNLHLTKQPEEFILWTLKVRLCETLQSYSSSKHYAPTITGSQVRKSMRPYEPLSGYTIFADLWNSRPIPSNAHDAYAAPRRHRSIRSGKVPSPDTAPQTECNTDGFETAQPRHRVGFRPFRQSSEVFEIVFGTMC
jgi:hypothetical protein